MRKRTLAVLVLGLVAMATTACTPREIRLWQQWNANDPEAAQAFLHEPWVQEELAHHQAPAPQASGYSSASSNGRCVGYEGLLAQYSPGWDVGRMSGIMYRESRCNPGVSNSCCHGLLQMHEMHVGWLDAVNSASDYYDPATNIRAAAQLWRSSGYGAWSTS
jgi:hypothetical protein